MFYAGFGGWLCHGAGGVWGFFFGGRGRCSEAGMPMGSVEELEEEIGFSRLWDS